MAKIFYLLINKIINFLRYYFLDIFTKKENSFKFNNYLKVTKFFIKKIKLKNLKLIKNRIYEGKHFIMLTIMK